MLSSLSGIQVKVLILWLNIVSHSRRRRVGFLSWGRFCRLPGTNATVYRTELQESKIVSTGTRYYPFASSS
ncbi:hypothetical protein L6164_010237 [Bauhinia variegata]|uniref:Uncharacterized protein n=1 Tax=Bauhinia variegata TaxID=167791 RepID=A0ACB9PLP3_BAUVA|nr:hypothetical protein L6164_010237 [Bauhinia variegata]